MLWYQTHQNQKNPRLLLVNHRAIAINPLEKIVTAVNTQGQEEHIGYERLVIATGATSRRPKIEGLDNPVILVKLMQHSENKPPG